MSDWPASWDRILDALMAIPDPLPLGAVSERAGLAPSTTLRHLTQMARMGLVRRTGARKDARYSPLSSVEVAWQHPIPDLVGAGLEPWVRLRWRCSAPTDWRFPLVSRVPDDPARVTLLRFFDEALARGLLTPWLLPPGPGLRSGRFLEELRQRRWTQRLSFHVYGSCATGTARADSDVDVLVLYAADGVEPASRSDGELVDALGYQDLASEINLGSSRPVTLLSMDITRFLALPNRAFRDRVVEEGITVYSSRPDAFFIEGLRRLKL